MGRSGRALAVTGVGLYVVAPSLLSAFGAWPQLAEVKHRWFLILVLLEAGSLASLWWLTRLALEPHRDDDARTSAGGGAGGWSWGTVATAQLAGNRGQQGGPRRCGDRRGGAGQAADPGR